MLGDRSFRAAFGRTGVRTLKREGDGATPLGLWPIRRVLYRRDKIQRPKTRLRVAPIQPSDGWCDAVSDRNYNRPVTHPYPASAEQLWRSDDVYDIVVILGHNDRPRRRGMGSAIFMHLARPGYTPTEGCIALSLRDLREVLRCLQPGSRVLIA